MLLPGTTDGQHLLQLCCGSFSMNCCAAGDGALLAHAAFRAPNLKTRMASARQEFRAVWRGYQSDFGHGYTL